MSLLLLIVLILFLVGGLPRFGYHSYGYGPRALLGCWSLSCSCCSSPADSETAPIELSTRVSQLHRCDGFLTARRRFGRAAYLHVTTHPIT